jgi:hypothetical protein
VHVVDAGHAGRDVAIDRAARLRSDADDHHARCFASRVGDHQCQGFAFAVSDFQLTAGGNTTVSINGTSKSWRIHDLTITAGLGTFFAISGDTFGVIDHLTFTGSKQEPLADASNANWSSWQQALSMGTGSALFFEDNNVVFKGQHDDGGGELVHIANGGRVVVRHNAVTNFQITGAGLDQYSDRASNPGASLQVEVYANQFTIGDIAGTWTTQSWLYLGEIDAGTGVWFDNTYTVDPRVTLGKSLTLVNARSTAVSAGTFGICDGTQRKVCSSVDINWKLVSGNTALIDCVQDTDCGTGLTCKWKLCSVTKTSLCAADSDCPGGETCSSYLDGPSSTGGYPCFAQPGFGAKMQSAPFYAWNNTLSGSKNYAPGPLPFVSNDSHVMEGRDFVNGTPLPGYVPYVYPHPLVQLGP